LGIEAIVNEIIVDTATGTWHIFARIAGKAYRAALDRSNSATGAIGWIFDKVDTTI
jgi:hypothetical protein